jgi:hypothetical protein
MKIMRRKDFYKEPLWPEYDWGKILKDPEEIRRVYAIGIRALARSFLELFDRHPEEWKKIKSLIDKASSKKKRTTREEYLLKALDIPFRMNDEYFNEELRKIGPSMRQASVAIKIAYEIKKEEESN